MASHTARFSNEEAARLGSEIYEREVRPKVSQADQGKFVAIDMETGQWELDADEVAAGDHLRSRIPDAQIWMARVGYGYIRSFGASFVRRHE